MYLIFRSKVNACYQLDQVCAVAPLNEKMSCFHLETQQYGILGKKTSKNNHKCFRQKNSKNYLGLKEYLSL